MRKSTLLFLVLCCLSFVFSPIAAQDDIPVIAIIKTGSLRPIDLAEQGILAVFEAYGYDEGIDIEFRHVDAAGDVTLLPSTIETLITEDIDMLIPLQAAVIAATLAVTEEMDNPPPVIFAVVQDPYGIGLAVDACTKPAYFTGQSSGGNIINVQELMDSIKAFNPELASIALVYNSNDAGAAHNAGVFEEVSEDYNVQIISQAVASGEEVMPVLETLVVNGAESILVIDVTVGQHLAEISEFATQAQIPVFAVDAGVIALGATLGVGTDFYNIGVNAGRIAVAYVEGEIDLATTGISDEISVLRALNLDVAAAQGQVIPDGFLDMMDFYIENGESSELPPSLPDISEDEMRAADAEFLASLQCPREPEATEDAGS